MNTYPKIKDYEDFLRNGIKIRKMYGGIYKEDFTSAYGFGWRKYIYSRTNISKKYRDLMWEYLNFDILCISDLREPYYFKKNKNS